MNGDLNTTEIGGSQLDFATMQPLLQEFEQMRRTLLGFVKLIKQRDERLKSQECRIAELEDKLAGIVLPTPEQIMHERYTESSKHNRTLNETPQRIALAAYLTHVKQIPNQRLVECGLMSASKLYGLKKWQLQHLLDYCTLFNVLDIYQNGLPEAEFKALLPEGGYDKLQAYLEQKNQSANSVDIETV